MSPVALPPWTSTSTLFRAVDDPSRCRSRVFTPLRLNTAPEALARQSSRWSGAREMLRQRASASPSGLPRKEPDTRRRVVVAPPGRCVTRLTPSTINLPEVALAQQTLRCTDDVGPPDCALHVSLAVAWPVASAMSGFFRLAATAAPDTKISTSLSETLPPVASALQFARWSVMPNCLARSAALAMLPHTTDARPSPP